MNAASTYGNYKLVGVNVASQSDVMRAFEVDRGGIQQAVAGGQVNPALMPPPRVPATAVFADGEGNQFTMIPGPGGPMAVPFVPATPMVMEDGQSGLGGYLSLDQLNSMRNSPAAAEALAAHRQLQTAAMTALTQGGAGGGQQASGSGGKPGPLDGLGSSLLQGMANSAFSYAVETGIQTGSLSGIFDTLLSGASSPADMLSGLSGMLAGQLAGMAGSMLLNSLWSVDDKSSTFDQAAHEAAQALVGQIGSVLTQNLVMGQSFGNIFANSTLGKILADLQGDAGSGGGGGIPALRLGDVDPAGDPVLVGSANVMIEGMPAARETDDVRPPGIAVYNGVAKVKINALPAGRLNSQSCIGPFTTAASHTFIGGAGTGSAPTSLAGSGAGAAASAAGAGSHTSANQPATGNANSEISANGESGSGKLVAEASSQFQNTTSDSSLCSGAIGPPNSWIVDLLNKLDPTAAAASAYFTSEADLIAKFGIPDVASLYGAIGEFLDKLGPVVNASKVIYYETQGDWRNAVAAAGEWAGSDLCVPAGAYLGAFLGPGGAVAGALLGNYYCGDAGKSIALDIYDNVQTARRYPGLPFAPYGITIMNLSSSLQPPEYPH